MNEFKWFVFNPLNIEALYREDICLNIDIDQMENWYMWWSDFYNQRAKLFYDDQYIRHKLAEFSKFSYKNRLGLSHPEELEESKDIKWFEAWQNWESKAEPLQKHWKVKKSLCQMLVRQIKKHPQLQSFNLFECLQTEEQMIKDGWTSENEEIAKAFWFNSNITKPSSDKLAELKSKEYGEYRNTSHWRKVQSAMRLIESSRCVDPECKSGDSFRGGGWETEIHVHHLHYENRGWERYEDLRLLCKEHHKKAHSK